MSRRCQFIVAFLLAIVAAGCDESPAAQHFEQAEVPVDSDEPQIPQAVAFDSRLPETFKTESDPSKPLACALYAVRGPRTEADQAVEGSILHVELINQANREVLLVRTLEGSDGRGRFPMCRFIVTDEYGLDVPRKWPERMCGNLGPIFGAAIAKVPAGKSFSPFWNGYKSSQLVEDFALQPGDYRVRFEYSTQSTSIDEWFGGPMGEAGLIEFRQRFGPSLARVPRTTVTSNEFLLKVH